METTVSHPFAHYLKRHVASQGISIHLSRGSISQPALLTVFLTWSLMLA